MFKRIFMVVVLLGITGAPVEAADGAKVWKKCKACHNYNKAKNKAGPHLQGIIGRKCGAAASSSTAKTTRKFVPPTLGLGMQRFLMSTLLIRNNSLRLAAESDPRWL